MAIQFLSLLKKDFRNYDLNNQDEAKVYQAHYYAGSKGALVFITGFRYSFSCGIIGLSKYQKYYNILGHEYGHYLQLKKRGWLNYIRKIVIYSVTENILYRKKKLPYDYYGSPWEQEADILGGVKRNNDNSPWPESVSGSYFEMIKLFRKTKR